MILAGVFLVLPVATMIFGTHFQSKSQLEAYKQKLRDEGEKLELGEVLRPPIPAESNSVDAVEEAFRLLFSHSGKIPDLMMMVAPGKAMPAWAQPDVESISEFTNSWDDFAIDLAADRHAIELLHQVLVRPKLDFQLVNKQDDNFLLSNLASMRSAPQRLVAASLLDLHNANTGAAATNILTILGLVQRSASDGREMISHMTRLAITPQAVAPTWELLQATNATDAQLAFVQQGWEQMDFLGDAVNAFVAERAWELDRIGKARASHEELEERLSSGSIATNSSGSPSGGWWEPLTEKPRLAIGKAMWRSSWSYSDELRALQTGSVIVEALRGMQTNQTQFYLADYNTMMTRLSALDITNVGAGFSHALNIPNLKYAHGKLGLSFQVRETLQIETARRVAVTAIALKRFQSAHGKLPATLEALVPEFLKSVPIDPNDGKALRYLPNTDGTYLLYSVGEDGMDDGGNPTVPASAGRTSFDWQHHRARDWVWPQPATPAEIKYFYDHPPK